ncbi:ClC voltage-gated chloride channel protein [Ceratobasidium theobromae]|uniref:ClC voltage-gated chloride channel protein n=1 Tax=Ceratobasidium theobromae TaxID=1582974 RepID=A0A5N5QCH5_9AGAM|nr:ClC voltage-gated chloride channel protein [Ceratobasidium theobromae]
MCQPLRLIEEVAFGFSMCVFALLHISLGSNLILPSTVMPSQAPSMSEDLHASTVSLPPRPGPLSAPASPLWRRRRLLNIGSRGHSPTATFHNDHPPSPSMAFPSYGAIPRAPGERMIHSSPGLEEPLLGLDFRRSTRPTSFFAPLGRRSTAYDEPANADAIQASGEDEGARINGVRVWYSSFTSIDWLHDAIKDSARTLHTRRRRSVRGRLLNLADRSIGWIIVTIVGFLTAVIAFLIIRAEQWLFDIKEGYCSEAWWRAMRFCCPMSVDNQSLRIASIPAETEACEAWTTWAEAFGPGGKHDSWYGFESWMIEYVSYMAIALALALTSSFLTIRLTASTSFWSYKDSGVLGPAFDPSRKDNDVAGPSPSSHVGKSVPRKVLYYAAGSGIPEIKTILSGFVMHGYLGGRTLFTKSVGLALSVASGLSLGKEGPFVHIASCVGNIVSRFFSKYETNEGKRREILSAACAAGVAVAFGAPVGGVLFSLEEVSYFFPPKVMWRSFFCAMVAAATLKFFDPFGTGKLVLFQVTYDRDWHSYELGLFLILGVFGGLYGAYFSKLNYRWSRHVRGGTWMKTHPISEVAMVTLLTTLLCFLNPYTRMGGTELVYNLLAECQLGDWHEGLCITPDRVGEVGVVIRAIGTALIVKGALTIITFGIKLPAGIFIPTLGAPLEDRSLAFLRSPSWHMLGYCRVVRIGSPLRSRQAIYIFLGACFGRIVGLVVQYVYWTRPNLGMFEVCKGDTYCVNPGVYAMIGAAATLSGVTRTTVSLAVIMFELTGTLTYVIPVMLSILVAKTVADALEPKDYKHEYLWGALQVSDVTDRKVETIITDEENTVQALRDKLLAAVRDGNGDGGLPILQREKPGYRMVGYIGTSELEHALTILADSPDEVCKFHATSPPRPDFGASSISSLYDTPGQLDPFDLTIYMDQAASLFQLTLLER